MSPSVSCALEDDVELRFERQPVDVARLIMGSAFDRIDAAVIHAASEVRPGDLFTATFAGWEIRCERTRERVVRVLGMVRTGEGSEIVGFAGAAGEARLAS